MDETSANDAFESLLHELAPRVPELDPLFLHGMLAAGATTLFADFDAIAAGIAPGGESGPAIVSAVVDVIEALGEGLSADDLTAPVRDGSADDGERWLQGYLRGVTLHEDQWAVFRASSDVVRDALAMCRTLAGEEVDGFSLPAHVDSRALLGSRRFLDDMAARIYWALNAERDLVGDVEFDPDALDDLPEYTAEALQAMDEDELIALVLEEGDRLPRGVVDECARRGEAFVPALRALIEVWEDEDDSDHWWSLLHAVKILGLIPGSAAGDALLEGFLVVHEGDTHLTDWLVTDWPVLFSNRHGHIFDAFRRIGEDRGIYWFTRTTAVQCVVADAFARGGEPLDKALDWVGTLVSRDADDADFRYIAALNLLHLPRPRHRAVLEQLADEQAALGAIERVFAPDDVDAAFREGDRPQWLHFADPWRFYDPGEIRSRQERWLREWERAEERDGNDGPDDFDAHGRHFEPPAPVETFVREQPKVGRNEPCPCGSGKKYKKCCLTLQ